MIIVLDTNILLVSIATKSKYRPIFDALIAGKYVLALSNSILSEYIEILEQKTTSVIASNIAELLLNLKNMVKTDVYYRWNLIKQDTDDNKFVDCAIAANANFIVTNDKYFKGLKNISFPKVKVISADEFLQKITK
ncbi:MAG: putative toxin-antitoxin system toxin component, PIN family [Acidobacteria bacterium]|nr:putative toxin-antitoxin system toxin component, PIN family [Acidobacteriota bacterium]